MEESILSKKLLRSLLPVLFIIVALSSVGCSSKEDEAESKLPKQFKISLDPRLEIGTILHLSGETNLPDGLILLVSIRGGDDYGASLFSQHYVQIDQGKFYLKKKLHYTLNYSLTVSTDNFGGERTGSYKQAIEVFGKRFKRLERGIEVGTLRHDSTGKTILESGAVSFRVGTKSDERSFLLSELAKLKKFNEESQIQYKQLIRNINYFEDTSDIAGFKKKMQEWEKSYSKAGAEFNYLPNSKNRFYPKPSQLLNNGWMDLGNTPIAIRMGDEQYKRSLLESYYQRSKEAKDEINNISTLF